MNLIINLQSRYFDFDDDDDGDDDEIDDEDDETIEDEAIDDFLANIDSSDDDVIDMFNNTQSLIKRRFWIH